MNRPAPLRTDGSNTFAHLSMKIRVPAIIQEILALNPDYSHRISFWLKHLHDEIQGDGAIPKVDLLSPDYESWAAVHAPHAEETWLNSEWFFTEVLFYRKIIDIVRWWETGRDPFAPKKAEEMSGKAIWERLELALTVRDLQQEERIASAIQNSLWGNRIDLSYAVAASHGSIGASEDLLVNDSMRAAEYLVRSLNDEDPVKRVVHLITDNAGTELATDLVLADTLIDTWSRYVILHVKLHPTFVSDATAQDVQSFIALMASGKHGSAAQKLAQRLTHAFDNAHLRIAPNAYWNSTQFAWDMPRHLLDYFKLIPGLVIVKGDANYRRFVGDALWPPTTPFSDVLSYFPAPVLAVRTLKSDPICGLPPGLAERLDTLDSEWHFNGRRGIIQMSQTDKND